MKHPPRRARLCFLLVVLGLLALAGCRTSGGSAAVNGATADARPLVSPPPDDGLPVLANPKPDGELPHDPTYFTQGLLFADGALFESTGRYKESRVMRLSASSGQVEDSENLAPQYFGEGLASFGPDLYQLTWTTNVCFVYDRATLEPRRQLFYASEGWGLTVSPEEKLLVFSDGSSTLHFLSPDNLVSKRQVTVTDGKGRPVGMVNELEWVGGEVWANIWMTDRIARIDPKTGKIQGWILCTDLVMANHDETEDVLNGIAYDPAGDTLWLTGKLWDKIYRFDGVKERFFKQSGPAGAPSDPTP